MPLAKSLIEKGADIKARDINGQTPIFYAANEKMAELLLEKDPNQVNLVDNHLKTPLHEAVAQKAKEVVEFLIQKGANISATTNEHKTALHILAKDASKFTSKIYE